MTDMDKALAQVPTTGTTLAVVQSGHSSDAATFGGRLPLPSDNVLIPAGLSLTLDSLMLFNWLRVDGSLSVDPAADSGLHGETAVTTMGSSFNLGSDANPITGSFRCIFSDPGIIDPTQDPWMIKRGLIAMGSVMGCGAAVTPWVEHTGASNGAMQVTLKTPVVGWSVGDPIVFAGCLVAIVDDDERTIAGISADGLTLTLDSPLSHDHLPFDQRPLFVLNRKRRKITFESENLDPARAGHVMVMNGNMVNLCHASFFNGGRTRKDIPVTDPDGLGGGTGNARGRYALHFHQNVGTWADSPAIVDSCYLEGGMGWGMVNHASFVRFQNDAIYKVFGSHFVCENGLEKGGVYNCAGLRSTNTARHADDDFETDVGLTTDSARNGYCVWTHGGQVEIVGNVAAGFPKSTGIFVQGIPFKVNNVAPLIPISDLKTPPINPITGSIISARVPLVITDNRITGCKRALGLWTINASNPIPKTSLIGIGRVDRNYLEASDSAITFGYSFYPFDGTDNRIPDPIPGGTGNNAIGHTGFTGGLNLTNLQMLAVPGRKPWANAAMGWTEHENTFTNCHFRAANGIDIPQVFRRVARSIDFTGCSWDVSGYKIRLRFDHLAGSLYNLYHVTDSTGKVLLNEWMRAMAPFFSNLTQCYWNDRTTFEGVKCYPLELAESFVLPQLPAELAGWTNGQFWSKYRLRLGARMLPASTIYDPSTKLECYTSADDAIPLPEMTVSPFQIRYDMCYQQTAAASGAIAVLDSKGNQVESGPFTWNPLGFNVPQIVVDGIQRGVLIRQVTTVAANSAGYTPKLTSWPTPLPMPEFPPNETPPPPSPPTCTLSASVSGITLGQSLDLTWAATNADTVTLNGVTVTGSPVTVTPTQTGLQTYTLVATGAGGTATASITVQVNPAPQPISLQTLTDYNVLIDGQPHTIRFQ